MRPYLVVTGAFVLILGFALINTGPTLTSASFYKEEAGLFSAQAGNPGNATASLAQLYSQEADAINQAEIILYLGAVLAPVGGAILALGLVTNGRKDGYPPKQPDPAPAR